MAGLQQAGGGEPSGTGNVNVQLKSVSSLAAETWSNCSSPAEFKVCLLFQPHGLNISVICGL